jgi:hypothetical protein
MFWDDTKAYTFRVGGVGSNLTQKKGRNIYRNGMRNRVERLPTTHRVFLTLREVVLWVLSKVVVFGKHRSIYYRGDDQIYG